MTLQQQPFLFMYVALYNMRETLDGEDGCHQRELPLIRKSDNSFAYFSVLLPQQTQTFQLPVSTASQRNFGGGNCTFQMRDLYTKIVVVHLPRLSCISTKIELYMYSDWVVEVPEQGYSVRRLGFRCTQIRLKMYQNRAAHAPRLGCNL